MRNLIRRILREQSEVKEIPIKFYMFDWDDNLLYMPTQIYVTTDKGKEIGMGTEDFAHLRSKLTSGEPFVYKGKTVKGMGENPFRKFRGGKEEFYKDVEKSKKAVSWPDLTEAINSGSYLAIITARGHNPQVIKDTLRDLINEGSGGISKEDLLLSLKNRKKLIGQKPLTPKEEINEYIDNCLFYTVGYYYSTGSAKPEEIKAKAMTFFQSSGNDLVDAMNDKLETDGINDYRFKAYFGFSDDDLKNIEFAKEKTKGIDIFYTGKGEKELVKKGEEGIKPEFKDDLEIQLENKLRNIIKKIIIYN
jgi:hypothetical protein